MGITMLSLRDDILIDGFDISFASNQLFIEMDSEDDGRVSFLSRNDARGGVVDFQDDNADTVALPYQTMRLPSLQFEAGVIGAGYTQNSAMRTQELNVPGCVNRQLGRSENDDSLCVCDRHKWRCTFGFPP